MGWKATGQPTVRKQRDKWVVRVDGIDTATGKHRPRQLGTYAVAALRPDGGASPGKADGRSTERGTVSWLVRRYVAGRTDITLKARESTSGRSRTSRPASARSRSPDSTARTSPSGSKRSPLAASSRGGVCRSVAPCCALRLADAVDEGLIPRSPAARVALPRTVAKPAKVKEIDAWDADRGDPFPRGRHGITAGRSGSASACSTDCAAARCWRSTGTTSTPTRGHCGSTRASSPSARARHGATPRTNGRVGASRSTTKRSAPWLVGGRAGH